MKKYVLLLLVMASGGCVFSPPGDAGSRLGRHYFLRECARCHALINPEERTADQWRHVLLRKKNKLSLTGDQLTKLEKYLIGNSRSRR